MPNPREFHPVFPKLHLGALAAINQKQMPLYFQHLRRWVRGGCGRGRMASEDC